MNPKAWLLIGATLVSGMAQATCYTVYKANGTVLQRSSTAPVNLSEQIGDTVPEKFGSGATMVVSGDGVYCMSASERQQAPKSLADAVLQDKSRKAAAGVKKGAAPADATKTAANQ
ncbi:MAG: hypothetical protein ACHP7E_04100 [Burkholderiales bacterium]